MLEVTDRKAMTPKYKVAVVKRPIEFSKETYTKAYNDFSQFVATNNTLEKMVENAEEAGYRLYTANDMYSYQHNIGGIRGTREALKWAFGAKGGEASGLYECGDSDHLMMVAVSGIVREGYRPQALVNDELRQELVREKKAEKIIADIEHLLSDGTKMVFITASMGGGTGTGSAPVVASVAKKMGLLTIGIVTIPFRFEKKQKIIRALKGVDEMRKNVDALLIINNERLCDVYADTPISVKESFARADDILKDAVMGISELITVNSNGGIDLDFRDVETTMRDGGGAIMAMGRASGEKRVERAIQNALHSPLL
jgi:hypothetical protein